jgi:hypothetical protein
MLLKHTLILVACLTAVGGCSFGPTLLQRTHSEYAEAVRRVDEEQLLRRIVHMRYNEPFNGVDITSIATQYELSASAEARPFFVAPNPSNSNIIFKTFTAILPDALVEGANRPTITLTPNDDAATIRQFLTPITLDTLVFLTQTSWSPATVLRLWAERINGVPNAVITNGLSSAPRPDFERFQRIAELMEIAKEKELAAIRTEESNVEVGGPIPAESITSNAAVEAAKAGMEYRPRPDGKTWVLTRKERRLVVQVYPPGENAPEIHELAELLHLVPALNRYEMALVAKGSPDPMKSPMPPADRIGIVPRSTAQVLVYLTHGVDVPPEHRIAGLVNEFIDADGQAFDSTLVTRGLFAVHFCKKLRPPKSAYVAVKYRGYWYYIDDSDLESKSTFALVFQLSRLDFSRQSLGHGPTLTLPVGR